MVSNSAAARCLAPVSIQQASKNKIISRRRIKIRAARKPSGHSPTSDVRAGLLADKIIKIMAVSRMDNISPRWFAFFQNRIRQFNNIQLSVLVQKRCLNKCAPEGWATYITICRQNGDNSETKAGCDGLVLAFCYPTGVKLFQSRQKTLPVFCKAVTSM
jgi:hypothetical protein